MQRILSGILFLTASLSAQEMPMYYNQNHDIPRTEREIALVEHAKWSYHQAMRGESKLINSGFENDEEVKIWKSDVPSDHLLNNLCSLEGAAHLHIGLYKGGSFIAALYQNQDALIEQIGMDWFEEYPEGQFYENCDRYLVSDKYQVINGDCFNIDKAMFTKPIDIYFYDADHSLLAQERAFTYYDDTFADSFIAVVDDWRCPWVRKPTYKAFEKLKYQILYEAVVPASLSYGEGQYLVVVRKLPLSE